MIRQKIKKYLESLESRCLDDVNLACEMMMFRFGDISIHSQCFTRIIRRERVLLTTLDYQNWDGETDTNNDEWHHLAQYKDIIVKNKVIKTELTDTNDVFIWLQNDICIQMLISNGSHHYGEACEQWRIFENNNKEAPHIVVYGETIESQ
jgi:hypothetical protein